MLDSIVRWLPDEDCSAISHWEAMERDHAPCLTSIGDEVLMWAENTGLLGPFVYAVKQKLEKRRCQS